MADPIAAAISPQDPSPMPNSNSDGSVQYVVISPVRNEELYLERVIKSMVSQTVRPAQWILVNDGSTDKTAEIIDRWAAEHSWIVACHRTESGRNSNATLASGETGEVKGASRGLRALAAKEIEAFYEGYARIMATDWSFLVKLDGDVGLESDYFEKCFAEFEAAPELGIGGGVICHPTANGQVSIERTPLFHVRGATKIYRRACWEQIGGVLRGAAWDTIDEVKANSLGWKTRSFEHLKVIHYRFTGAANGAWRNAVKNGTWNYVSGYHPLFMLVRVIRRLFKRPYLIGAVGLSYGFLLGYLRPIRRVDDVVTLRYLREQQMRRLLLRPSIWK